MKRRIGLLLIVSCVFAVQAYQLYANEPSPNELVAAHLKSIGEQNLLPHIKSISFIGGVETEFILGMSGHLTGITMLMSEGEKFGLTMRFQDLNYPAEHFAFDGNRVTVGTIMPGLRSPLADFLFRYDKVMGNGMLGGVFSTSWPLLDIAGNQPTMQRVRTVKVDGADLYELEYRPRDFHGDMRIRLYFEPETYRHVRTEYRVRTENDVTTGFNSEFMPITQLSTRGESFYTLTEKFGDFRKIGGLTMPYSYTLDYMIDGYAQSGFIASWKMTVGEIGFNSPNIEQGFFTAEKQ